jgi:hypothetical protein
MPILRERPAIRGLEFVGKRARVVSGPCVGQVGVITDVKVHPSREGVTTSTGEFRIEFRPPIHLAAVGFLSAVWRKPIDFTVVA